MVHYQKTEIAGMSSSRRLAVYLSALTREILKWTGNLYNDDEVESTESDPVKRLDLLALRDRRAIDTLGRLGEESLTESELWNCLSRVGSRPSAKSDMSWKKLSRQSPCGHLLSALIQLLDRSFDSTEAAAQQLEQRAIDFEKTLFMLR